VSEEMANCNFALASLGELWEVLGRWIVQPQPSLLHKEHDGRGRGDDFSQGCQVEHRIRGHWLNSWLHTSVAISLLKNNSPVVTHQYDGSGRLSVYYRAFDSLVNR
jgi:hypothetical protein